MKLEDTKLIANCRALVEMWDKGVEEVEITLHADHKKICKLDQILGVCTDRTYTPVEPKFREFRTPEEITEAVREHGKKIGAKGWNLSIELFGIRDNEIYIAIENCTQEVEIDSAKAFLNSGYVFLSDNHPFGVKE